MVSAIYLPYIRVGFLGCGDQNQVVLNSVADVSVRQLAATNCSVYTDFRLARAVFVKPLIFLT